MRYVYMYGQKSKQYQKAVQITIKFTLSSIHCIPLANGSSNGSSNGCCLSAAVAAVKGRFLRCLSALRERNTAGSTIMRVVINKCFDTLDF